MDNLPYCCFIICKHVYPLVLPVYVDLIEEK